MQKDKNLIFILAAMAMIMGFFAHIQGRPLFGDECTELLQALDRPKGFFILTPSFSANWIVSTIESCVTYIYSFFLKNFGFKNGLVAIRAVHVAFFTFSAVLLYLVLRRLVSSFWAFSGSIIFIFSNYALCFMQILTRNSMTPFWVLSSLLFLGMVFNYKENVNKPKKYQVLFLMMAVITSTLGLVTYSGFRIYVTALSLALFINCVLYQRKKIIMALFFPLTIVGLLSGLLVLSDTTAEAFIYRGSYALVKKEHFLEVFYQVILFPFKFYKYGHFVVEQAHVLVGRSPFPFYLIPFFCIGLFLSFSKSFYNGKREDFYNLVFLRNFLIISVLLFSFLGPNLKYFYGLWPVLIIFCVMGMEKVMVRINPSDLKQKMMIGALLFIFAFEQVYYFSFQMKNSASVHAFLYQDAQAKQLIDKVRPIIEFDEKPSLIYSPLGRDVALWYAKSTDLQANILDRWAVFLQDKGFVNLEKDTSLNLEGFLFTKNNLNEGQKSGLKKVLKNNPKLKWIQIDF
ncbi:MAG TPA: hypothetical protein PKC21_04720 [Oligoflexia bacterium]|nr:hypothetical protein [Oligoflexia bacterium]HMR24640.1 hypothetical protein [Oligoflexia bacterium]